MNLTEEACSKAKTVRDTKICPNLLFAVIIKHYDQNNMRVALATFLCP